MRAPASRKSSPRAEAATEAVSGPLLDLIVDDGADWSAFQALDQTIGSAADALARRARDARLSGGEVTILLSDDARIREMNAQWRGFDKATNVLSFPSGAVAGRQLGDVALARETLEREAGEQGIPKEHHLQHLVIHALLHLLGYDHETEEQALAMEGLEIEVLADLGVPNPYGDEHVATRASERT